MSFSLTLGGRSLAIGSGETFLTGLPLEELPQGAVLVLLAQESL